MSIAERPTLLFYCQHAPGLGHLVRILNEFATTKPSVTIIAELGAAQLVEAAV